MKKLLLTLLAAAVTLAAAAGGISSAAELAAFAEAVNAGGDIAAWQDERGEVHLKADIDMSGIKRFARIGNFEGVFDGEGHAILNWKTDGGLFRLVAEGSVVRNLVIAESCSMKVSDDGDDALYAGFVADVNHGILERCENYGSIAHRSARSLHDNYVGGVCGMNKYVVIRCKNGGDISSAGSCLSLAPTAEPRMYLGGVLGGSLGRSLPGAFVAWCENTGRVGYSGAFIVSHIGGIVGYNMRVKTKFCINRGEIVSAARGVEEGSDRYCQEMAGGICGMAKGDVMCCDNFGLGHHARPCVQPHGRHLRIGPRVADRRRLRQFRARDLDQHLSGFGRGHRRAVGASRRRFALPQQGRRPFRRHERRPPFDRPGASWATSMPRGTPSTPLRSATAATRATSPADWARTRATARAASRRPASWASSTAMRR